MSADEVWGRVVAGVGGAWFPASRQGCAFGMLCKLLGYVRRGHQAVIMLASMLRAWELCEPLPAAGCAFVRVLVAASPSLRWRQTAHKRILVEGAASAWASHP